MERARRRELTERHRQQLQAGVFAIVHEPSGRTLVGSTTDLAGACNRLAFAITTDAAGALDPRLRPDAAADGLSSLRFEVLDVLEARDASSEAELRGELTTLAELWRERLDPALRY